ncbi:MAG: hypothetical protein ACQES4_05635 [Bacillota bacterium]
MKLEGNCQTTAMGIMPHKDVDRALDLALSLDIPFWPQLPKVNFFEDMYAQVSEHFPGIILDTKKRVVSFSIDKFYENFEEYIPHLEEEEFFRLSPARCCLVNQNGEETVTKSFRMLQEVADHFKGQL